MENKAKIQELIAQGVLFAVNHSGGKDSQAMMIKMLEVVPTAQMVVVHAALGEVEWDGALELAQKQAADAGVPFLVAKARHKDGSPKDFFSMVEHNIKTKGPNTPPFPTSKYRQCTSDLKRGPIERELIAFMKANGFTKIVNCEGIRAAESAQRSKYSPFEYLNDKRNSKGEITHQLAKAGRQAWNWLPIFELSTEQVFATIEAAGQKPHWAYEKNERLSCVFCIFGSKNDILHGAQQRPDLLAKWSEVEQRTGFALHMSRVPLAQMVAEAQAEVEKMAA